MQHFDLLAFKALSRIWPAAYRHRLSRWASKVQLRAPVLLLSFDCDTDRDAKAALAVQRHLQSFGMTALYAVPGELLEEHWEDYRDLLKLNATFINHGYQRHAEVNTRTGRPYSTFTYSGVSSEVWKADILEGHKTLTKLLGAEPKVFRTPHFGEFNTKAQLEEMYSYLAGLGYLVSSSTTPVFGMINGSVYKGGHGILELPLSGCLSKPTQLIDSWGFVSAPDALGLDELINELEKYLVLFKKGGPVVLNMYFDPADIFNEPRILEAISHFAEFGQRALDDVDLLSLG